MDTTESVESSESIKAQIDSTRAHLGEKLEILEHEVRSTFANASTSVSDKISDIKETFNIKHQIEKNPWASFGIALGLGTATSLLLKSFMQGREHLGHSGVPPKGNVLNSFVPELDSVKSLILGTALGTLGEKVKDSVGPSLRPTFIRIVNEVSRKLGSPSNLS